MTVARELKLVCAIIAVVFVAIGFGSYIRDIFHGKSAPHLYTWLIWGITQGTAATASWYGGGGFGAICLATETLLVILIVCLTFKYGSKDITNVDTIFLILALISIVVWRRMSNPFIAVLMVTAVDAIGYIPTIRKTFVKPWSETRSFWAVMAVANVLIIASSAQYNVLTTIYASVLSVGNITVLVICIIRRRLLKEGWRRCQ